MGLKTAPAYIGQTGYLHPVELDRNILEALTQRSGMFRFGDMAVTPTGVSGQISVAAGRAALQGVENANQGSYIAYSDGADLLSVAAASGNPRIDSLLLRVKDDQYGTISGSPAAYYDVVQGVAAGSPTARADSDFNTGGSFYVPGAWFRIADIRRNLGDTTIPSNQITHNLRYVRTPGGIVLCTSTTRPTDGVIGDVIYETDTKYTLEHNGTKWLRRLSTVQMVTDESRTSTTTYSDVSSANTLNSTGWQFPVEANCRYPFEMDVGLFGANTFGCKMNVVFPSGATVNVGWIGVTTSGAMSAGWVDNLTSGNDIGQFGGGGATFLHRIKGDINVGGTAGTVKFQFAQAASSGTASLLKRGSVLQHWQTA